MNIESLHRADHTRALNHSPGFSACMDGLFGAHSAAGWRAHRAAVGPRPPAGDDR